MLKKLLWLTILVLVTACTIYVSSGGLNLGQSTETPTVVATTPGEITATIEVTPDGTPTPETTVGPTVTSTVEETPAATATEIATSTPTAIPPTATATAIPSATPTATAVPMAYDVQSTTPVFMTNFAHTDAACNWQGIAGQVFDKSGNTVNNFVIKISGTYNNAALSSLAVTGLASVYGPGGYEVVLGTTAIDSTDLLSIQVFDATGKAVTNSLKFSTSSDCSKNLVIINFKEN